MANGFAPYLLNDIKSTVGNANASTKVDLHGFLKYLYTGAGANPIQTSTLAGHKKEVRFNYRQRNTKAQTDTVAACDVVLTPARLETTVSVGNTRQIAWHLPHALVAQYMEEASARTNLPGSTPLTGVSAEMVEILYSGANAILKAMNDDTLGLITWGKNSVTGASTATTLNIPKDRNIQDLGVGMIKLLSDYHLNGLTGRPQVVGSGLMYSYMLSQPSMGGQDIFGFSSMRATQDVDFYADQDFASVIGANHFGVFEPGSIQIVEYIENLGFQAGRLANSQFGVLPIPVVDPLGNAVPVMFDFQLKEIDCPTTLTDAYTGDTATYTKGYSLALKKDWGLFQLPADSYRHEDAQRSVNGALRYNATNACDVC